MMTDRVTGVLAFVLFFKNIFKGGDMKAGRYGYVGVMQEERVEVLEVDMIKIYCVAGPGGIRL